MADRLGQHLAGAVAEAASRAQRAPSRSGAGSSTLTTETKAEGRRRMLMMAKLFHLFPAVGDKETIELRIDAYMDELTDIHVDVLGPALRRLVRDHGRGAFLPSVAEIRRSAAFVLRAVRGGRDPAAPQDTEPAVEPNVERLLAAGPRPGAPCPYPQLASGALRQLPAGAR